VFWAMLAVLFLMLGIRRWLGTWPAIVGGLLLTLDPARFFLGVLDWGAAVPALFCRCLAFYFGSVWWRSRNAGCLLLAGLFLGLGVFNKIDLLVFIAATGIAAMYVPLWLVLGIAVVAVAGFVRDKPRLRAIGFLLTSLILTTAGVLLMPGAVRIHHAILAFPFPQLIIVTAFALLWNATGKLFARRALRIAAVLSLVLLAATQVYAIVKTEKLIAATGGRGRWSNALDAFCRENKDRPDLVIVSLDWGFNEQVAFLTDRPQLVEPFWAF